MPPEPNANQPWTDLVALVLAVLPRVDPVLDAHAHVTEQLVRRRTRRSTSRTSAPIRYDEAAGSRCRASPRTRRRTASSSRCPSRSTGRSGRGPTRGTAGRGRAATAGTNGPTRTAALREQLALVDEIGGEERDEQQLRDLARFEGERRRHATHKPRAVDRATDAREHRHEQEPDPEQQQRCSGSARRCRTSRTRISVSTNTPIADRDPYRLDARLCR